MRKSRLLGSPAWVFLRSSCLKNCSEDFRCSCENLWVSTKKEIIKKAIMMQTIGQCSHELFRILVSFCQIHTNVPKIETLTTKSRFRTKPPIYRRLRATRGFFGWVAWSEVSYLDLTRVDREFGEPRLRSFP